MLKLSLCVIDCGPPSHFLQPMETQWENSRRMTEAEKLSLRNYNVERFLIYCWQKVSIVASNKNL